LDVRYFRFPEGVSDKIGSSSLLELGETKKTRTRLSAPQKGTGRCKVKHAKALRERLKPEPATERLIKERLGNWHSGLFLAGKYASLGQQAIEQYRRAKRPFFINRKPL